MAVSGLAGILAQLKEQGLCRGKKFKASTQDSRNDKILKKTPTLVTWVTAPSLVLSYSDQKVKLDRWRFRHIIDEITGTYQRISVSLAMG